MNSEVLLNAVRDHMKGKISYHRANIEVYLSNPSGIGEHPDIVESIESELEKLSHASEILETLEKYFDVKNS